jgi:hypothetical protein
MTIGIAAKPDREAEECPQDDSTRWRLPLLVDEAGSNSIDNLGAAFQLIL